MSKVSKVVSGWKNDLIKDPKVEKLARERMEICMGSNTKPACEKYGMIHILGFKLMGCQECGCPINKKVRSTDPDNKCELGKWQ